MDFLQAIILSIVEGISEFLPISSTGHMVLISVLLRIQQTEFVKSFEIFIQLGAILAVVVLYYKTFLQNKEVWKRIIVAFIPTAIIGYALYKIIKHLLLGNTMVTVLAILIGGIAMIVLELLHKEKDHHKEKIEEIPLKSAFFIGVFQSISVIPGVSRAAATIIGGLFMGTKRKAAVEFSFLLAVPTMLAATGLDMLKTGFSFSAYDYLLLSIGFVGAFVVALFAIKFFLKFVQKHTLIPFGIYRIILAILFLLFIH